MNIASSHEMKKVEDGYERNRYRCRSIYFNIGISDINFFRNRSQYFASIERSRDGL